MKAIIWILAILVVSTSCDESELDKSETEPHKKRISSINASSYGGSYTITYFQYTGETVSQERSVVYEPGPNGEYLIVSDHVAEYKYSGGVLTRIEYAPTNGTDFEYSGERITKFALSSGDRSTKYVYDNAIGKLARQTTYYANTIGRSTTITEVVWDNNNIERGFISQSTEYRGVPEPNVRYDTVLFEYGDQVNVFADTTYLGYILRNVGSLFPFSQNNLLKTKRPNSEAYSAYEYTFSDDNYLIKLTVSTINNNVSTETFSWTIEYEE